MYHSICFYLCVVLKCVQLYAKPFKCRQSLRRFESMQSYSLLQLLPLYFVHIDHLHHIIADSLYVTQIHNQLKKEIISIEIHQLTL